MAAVTALALAAGCAPPQPKAAEPVASSEAWARYEVVRDTIDPVARYRVVLPSRSGRWLAAGDRSPAPGSTRQPAVWTSADGRRWDPATLPEVTGASASVAALASASPPVGALGAGASDETFVAAGSLGSGPDAVPVVWTSKGGQTWDGPVRLPVPDGLRGAVATAAVGPAAGSGDAASAPGGAEAIGGVGGVGGVVVGGGPRDGTSGRPLVWRSDDGSSWSAVDVPSGPGDDQAGTAAGAGDGGAPAAAPTGDASTAGATRRVVALARQRGRLAAVVDLDASDPNPTHTLAPLVSDDGMTLGWGTPFGPIVPPAGVSGDDGGFLAAGGPTLATSTDGRTWTTGDLPRAWADASPGPTGARPEVRGVASRVVSDAGSGLHRVGHGVALTPEALADPEAWIDLGQPAAPPGGATSGLVAVRVPGTGSSEVLPDRPGGDAVDGVEAVDAVVVPLDARGEDTQAWRRSSDGTWSVSQPRQLPPGRRTHAEQILGLASGNGLVVAVGRADQVVLDDGTGTGTTAGMTPGTTASSVPVRRPPTLGTTGRAWYSKDGRVWTEAILSSAVRSVDAVAPRGNGFVAVGRAVDASGADEALLWVSEKGTGWGLGGRLPAGVVPAGVVAFGADVLVVGRDADGRPGAWRTLDGATWQVEALPVDAEPGTAAGVCATPTGVLVVGSAGGRAFAVSATPGAPVGSSSTWSPVAAPAGSEGDLPVACAADEAGRVVVAGDDGQGRAVAWTLDAGTRAVLASGRARGVGSSGGRLVVVGTDDRTRAGAVWTQAAPGDWRVLTPPTVLTAGEPGAGLAAVVGFGDRTVAGGSIDDAPLALLGPAGG